MRTNFTINAHTSIYCDQRVRALQLLQIIAQSDLPPGFALRCGFGAIKTSLPFSEMTADEDHILRPTFRASVPGTRLPLGSHKKKHHPNCVQKLQTIKHTVELCSTEVKGCGRIVRAVGWIAPVPFAMGLPSVLGAKGKETREKEARTNKSKSGTVLQGQRVEVFHTNRKSKCSATKARPVAWKVDLHVCLIESAKRKQRGMQPVLLSIRFRRNALKC